jgi:hypothetical protein
MVIPRREDRPKSITVASSRTPAAIAADIQRRYIPKYLQAHAAQLDRVQRTLEKYALEDQIAREIAALAGTTPQPATSNGGRRVYVELAHGRLTVEISGYNDGTVKLDGYGLTPRAVKAIVAAGLGSE